MVVDRDGRTPGELLREARDARRMTLEQLSTETKIPQRLLQALEGDEYHKVSGSLYIKSFLRAFAEAVGLDPGEIVALYELGRGKTVAAPEITDAIWQDAETEIHKVGVAYGRLFRRWGVVAVPLVALAVWWFLLRDGHRVAESPTEQSVVETLLADDTGSSTVAAILPDTARAEPPDQSLADRDADTLAAGREDVSAVVTNATTIDAAPSEPEWRADPDPDLPPARRGDQRVQFSDGRVHPLILRLLCKEPIPVSVGADGVAEPSAVAWPPAARPGRLPAARIVAGRPYSVRQGVVIYWGADDHFNLQLGRFDGVELTLNGTALATGAWRPGQVILIDGDSAVTSPDR